MTQATAAQLPDCDLTGSQSQPAQCVAHLGTPALQTIVYTHDGESQAVLKPSYAEHAKGGTLTPGGHDSCRADASESVRIHSGLL